MSTMIEPGYLGAEAGTSDRVFTSRLRQLLRDLPVAANEQANGDGVSTLFQLTKIPVYDDQNTIVTVGGNIVPIVRDRGSLGPGNVFFEFDTGMVIFGSAPPAASNEVAFQKTRVRWAEGTLLQSLEGGLRMLFPAQFKIAVDTSITLQVNQWDYTLPNAFWDPRCRIISVSTREIPASVNRVIPISGFTRRGLNTIEIPTSQRYTPGSTVFIEYTAPYRSLSELEPQLYDLPLWYAAGQLLGFDEARRTRVDTQSPAAEASANPPGYQQNTGAWYMTQFRQMLATFPPPVMRMPRPISTYEL
jgi:hypothetical protein